MIKVILNSRKEIYNATDEQVDFIKSQLTLPNPAYISALKYSPYANVKVPKTISYYEYVDGGISVPRGYKIPFDHEVIEDNRFENKVRYPKLKVVPRDMQIDAIEAFSGSTDSMLISPTGSGKSVMALAISAKIKNKALIIVHKDDLVFGWMDDSKKCFGLLTGQIGLIKAHTYRIGKWITISTIQTLSKLPEEKLQELYNTFGLVILDECLVGNSLILKNDGGWDEIREINDSDELLGGKVSNKFNSKKSTIIIESPYGKIEGSLAHKTFFVPNSIWGENYKGVKLVSGEGDFFETTLRELKEGDYIPVLKKIPHTTKYHYSPEQLGFVALIMADGHMDKGEDKKRIKINVTKDKDWYRKTFTEGANSWGEFDVRESTDCRGNLTMWINSQKLRNILINTFEVPFGKKSNKIKTNKYIQYSPIESIKRFVEVMLNCESDLNKQGNSCRISIGLTSERMIKDLQLLLKKFGILSTYFEIDKKENNKKWSNSYRLGISGEFFNKFMDEFNLIDRKMTKHRNEGKTNGYIHAGDNYILSKIKKIIKTNIIKKVYDFTTTEHFFIANGVMTHNCHHVPASSFSLINNFKAKYHIGLSATPLRNDGLGAVFEFYFGKPCFVYKESEENKDIIPPSKVFIKRKIAGTVFSQAEKYVDTRTGNELNGIYDNGVYYKISELSESRLAYLISAKKLKRKPMDYMQARKTIQNDEHFMKQLCNDIELEFKQGKSCIVFCFEKEHCRDIESFLRQKIPSDKMQLYYGDSNEPKAEMKRKAENKEVLITIATYSIGVEGTNIRSWERVFFTIGPANEKDTIQAIGRGRRTFAGKNDLIVYDYVFPNVKGIRNHYAKREKVYKEIGFKSI